LAGAAAALLVSGRPAIRVMSGGPEVFLNGFLYADALPALVTLLTAGAWAVIAAHSEAPVPAAALMATAVLNCALGGFGRFCLLASRAAGQRRARF
jgi:hypothetical protein